MFPLAQIAREQKKLVIPIFVRPSFEQHEVDKRHYDHAVPRDRAIRLSGHPADRDSERPGYTETTHSRSRRLGRMNGSVRARLRGLIYVLWDLSQVDPSDSRSCLPARAVCESVSVRSILRTAPTRAINWWRPQPPML